MKQETLEEAAQKRFPINHNLSILERMGLNSAANMGFIEGAKWQQEQEKITTDDAYNEGFENGKHWQQERSYSEEEVIQFVEWLGDSRCLDDTYKANIGWVFFMKNEKGKDFKPTKELLNEWFKQFKKE